MPAVKLAVGQSDGSQADIPGVPTTGRQGVGYPGANYVRLAWRNNSAGRRTAVAVCRALPGARMVGESVVHVALATVQAWLQTTDNGLTRAALRAEWRHSATRFNRRKAGKRQFIDV